jgi:hypothetical protein
MESTKRKNSDSGSSPNKKTKTAQEATQIPPIQTLTKLRVPLYQTTDPNEPYYRSPKKALLVASNTMEQPTTEAGAMKAAEERFQAPENRAESGNTEVAQLAPDVPATNAPPTTEAGAMKSGILKWRNLEQQLFRLSTWT